MINYRLIGKYKGLKTMDDKLQFISNGNYSFSRLTLSGWKVLDTASFKNGNDSKKSQTASDHIYKTLGTDVLTDKQVAGVATHNDKLTRIKYSWRYELRAFLSAIR